MSVGGAAETGVGADGPGRPNLDPQLLEILRCPETHSELTLVAESGAWFLEGSSGNRYPIVDGVPVMLLDAAHRVPPTASSS